MTTRLKYVLIWAALMACTGPVGAMDVFIVNTGLALARQGESASPNVYLLVNSEPVLGFSFGITHPDGVLELVSMTQGSAVAATNGGAGADFFSVDLAPAGGTGGTVECLISETAADSLPAGGPKQIVQLSYDVPITAPVGIHPLFFSSSLGDPAVPIALQLLDPPDQTEFPLPLRGAIVVLPMLGGGPIGEAEVWIPNKIDDDISLLTLDGEVLGTTTAPGEEFPVAMAVAPTGLIWVTFKGTDVVARFGPEGTLIDVIPVGDSPRGIALDTNGDAWVTNFDDDTVTKISATGEILFGGDATDPGPGSGVLGPAIPVAPEPQGIGVDRSNNVYVVSTGSPALTKLNSDGLTLFAQPLTANSAPWHVVVDRDELVWISYREGDLVERRASDGSLAESFLLDPGARPEGMAIRGIDEAWVFGSEAGLLYRLRPGQVPVSFPTTASPSGITTDGAGFLWVADRNADTVTRHAPDGSIVGTSPVGNNPLFLGDGSGYVQANVLFPLEDFDLDTFPNDLEIDTDSNPLDPDDTPPLLPGFVDPVVGLLCDVEVQAVSLSWTNPDPNPYTAISIRRDGVVVATLPADATEFAEPGDLDLGFYSYEVVGEENDESSPSTTCVVTVGQGQILEIQDIQVPGFNVNLYGITSNPNAGLDEPRFWVTDPANNKIYGTDVDYDVLVVLDSPFEGIAPTTGIAFIANGNNGAGSLFVAAGANGDPNQVATIAEVTLMGELIGDFYILVAPNGVGTSPIEGGLGGMDHKGSSDGGGTMMVLGPDNCELYGFTRPSGLGLGTIEVPIIPAASATHPNPGPGLNGIYFPEFLEFDETGGTARVTSPGPNGTFQIAQVEIADGVASFTGTPVPLAAADSENAFGGFVLPGDEFAVVGVTTSTVYEILGAFFLRGDVNGDGLVFLDDAIEIIYACFGFTEFNSCIDAYDADDSGVLDVADPILVVNYAFLGGPPPAPPFPNTGPDQTADSLPCL